MTDELANNMCKKRGCGKTAIGGIFFLSDHNKNQSLTVELEDLYCLRHYMERRAELENIYKSKNYREFRSALKQYEKVLLNGK